MYNKSRKVYIKKYFIIKKTLISEGYTFNLLFYLLLPPLGPFQCLLGGFMLTLTAGL